MMNIICTNDTRQKVNCKYLSNVARRYIKTHQSHKISELSIAIVGERRMRMLNRQFRHLDTPTNILTFVYEVAGEKIGEIYLNPQWAAQKGHSLKELLEHGIGHCFGKHHTKSLG